MEEEFSTINERQLSRTTAVLTVDLRDILNEFYLMKSSVSCYTKEREL